MYGGGFRRRLCGRCSHSDAVRVAGSGEADVCRAGRAAIQLSRGRARRHRGSARGDRCRRRKWRRRVGRLRRHGEWRRRRDGCDRLYNSSWAKRRQRPVRRLGSGDVGCGADCDLDAWRTGAGQYEFCGRHGDRDVRGRWNLHEYGRSKSRRDLSRTRCDRHLRRRPVA